MKTNARMERIERLLYQLRDELEHGIIANDIEEALVFDFYIPFSRLIRNGMVYCDITIRPIGRENMNMDLVEQRMDLVKGGVYEGW